MKRILHRWLFVPLMLMACLAVSAADFESGGLYYNILSEEDHTVEVTVHPNSSFGYSGDIVIPSTVNYNGIDYSVTSIGYAAFYYCRSLTTIEIPNSVTSIGERAFLGCSSLTSIEVDAANMNYKSIDGVLFTKDETQLIKYPAGNINTSYSIPNSVTSIENGAFQGCSSLTSIEIPNSVTSIGLGAFDGCSFLTSIEIPNSVTSIGEYAFSYCDSLISIEIPNSVTSIGEYAFSGCSSLTSIEIPNSVSSIGNGAFLGCSSLTSIEIPNSVTSIGKYAFSGCSSLTSIEIPNSVTSIGGYAFSSLTSIEVDAANMNYKSIDGVLFTKDETQLIKYPAGNINTSYSIPNSVTSIGDSAFSYCDSLTSIEIPNSVTSIGEYAFSGCSSLTSIYYNSETPASVKDNNFGDDFDYSKVTLYVPEGAKAAFEAAEPWNRIENIIEIKNFDDIKNTLPEGTVFAVGELYYKVTHRMGRTVEVTKRPYGSGEYSGDIVIPSTVNYNGIDYSVTSIGEYAFYGCSSLTSVEIPNSVTSIGVWAFSGCSSLTSIEIPNSVTSIGNSAFSYCRSLTTIEIPNSVTSIEEYAFYGCSSLTSIEVDAANMNYKSIDGVLFTKDETQLIKYPAGNINTSYSIPNSVTSIGDSAFYGCSSLTSIEIPNSVTSIGGYAFSECSSLTSIEIPNSVTSIGERAFEDCTSLTSIELPNSVTSIENGAFLNCSSLTSIELPNSVSSIGYYVFYGCSSLTAIYYNSENPVSRQPIFSDDFDYSKVTLYVPDGAKGSFEAVEPWNQFENIVEIMFGDVPAGDANGNGKVTVADAVHTGNYAIGNEVRNFYFRAADVNGDHNISVSDVVGVVNIILDQPARTKSDAACLPAAENGDRLIIGSPESDGNSISIPVMLDNSRAYSALQGDLIIPSGMIVTDMRTAGRASDHALAFRQGRM